MPKAFSFLNKTRGKVPGNLPFKAIKEKVLGTNYELSVVFITPKESQKLNRIYRNKNKPTNVLSFPLDKHAGEIVICPSYAKSELKDFGRTFSNYLVFLFIHGLMHLKGFDHGSRMEREEAKIRQSFGI
jgi:probable rRNA maturation factor